MVACTVAKGLGFGSCHCGRSSRIQQFFLENQHRGGNRISGLCGGGADETAGASAQRQSQQEGMEGT
jgi:hypothetical protein